MQPARPAVAALTAFTVTDLLRTLLAVGRYEDRITVVTHGAPDLYPAAFAYHLAGHLLDLAGIRLPVHRVADLLWVGSPPTSGTGLPSPGSAGHTVGGVPPQLYEACRDLTLKLVAAIAVRVDDGHMAHKKCISEVCSLVLRRTALTVTCSAAALAVAQSQAMAAPPSRQEPTAARATAPAPDCRPPLGCGHLAQSLRWLGFPVLPTSPVWLEWKAPEMRVTAGQGPAISSYDIAATGPQGFQR